MKNKIEDLRNHLFAVLEALQDKENPMDIERARAIAEVADRVIDSAKVEVRYIEVTGNDGSGFIPDAKPAQPQLPAPAPQAAAPRLVK